MQMPPQPWYELAPEHQGNPDEMVNFGEVSRRYLGKQAQYGCRYVDGFDGDYPNLGEGLHFEGSPDDYHGLQIRQGDIPTFVERYREHCRKTYII